MANFITCSKFQVFDDYYTPKVAWERISHLLPTNKVIWEAFMLNSTLSKSKKYLEELGHTAVGNTELDFLTQDPPEYDIIVSNPPFDKKVKIPILKKLVKLDKPFVIIMNSCNLFSNYFSEIFKDKRCHLQIVYPRGKLYFEKLEGDKTVLKKNTSFYCVYVCYKMNIPNDQLYLD